jgi:MinD superfamily P-loop ATPase
LKQLVVLSGKGGTGKTTLTAALAHLASRALSVVLADADVDAANLELVLDPVKREEHDFTGGQVAVIDPALCTGCGICVQVCRFEAISETGRYGDAGTGRNSPRPRVSPSPSLNVDSLACEGCATCYYQCPEKAIRMEEQKAGLWFRSDTRFGPLFHAHLFAGQENSGKLVTLVKQQARLLALDTGASLVLVDGPPGIGCPVISASAGADLALLVVEPTVSGVHDLKRVLATTEHFGVPALVVINKADLNLTRTEEIGAFCLERGIEVVGRIPYDTVVTEAMVQGKPVTEYASGPVTAALEGAWAVLQARLG